MKKILALIMAAVVLGSFLTGCAGSANVDDNDKTEKKTTTTTTTTRTTEDLNTTFKEAVTNEVYPALRRDSNGNYPYLISSYTTYYDASNSTRTKNISNAVKKLNRLKIPNKATFSFNQTVGKRTVLAGYQEAKVVQGDEFVDGLGGGICQVSSTVFQAALRADLDITVRACHSLEISYVPLGADATVQWNSQDFQFVNDSGCDLQMRITASDGTLKCSIYAAKDIDPGNVKIKVSKNGSEYVLTRTVNGKTDYTTYSKYKKAKASTTKKAN